MRATADPPPTPAPASQLLSTWRQAISGQSKRVALADGEDPRAVEAAITLHEQEILEPVLIGRTGRMHAAADEAGLTLPPEIRVIDVEERGQDPLIIATLAQAYAGRPVTAEQLNCLCRDPLCLAAALLRQGEVDGAVGGASRPTADLLRVGLRVIGLAPSIRTVSSCFLMVLPDGRRIAYADCAVLPDPSVHQLADIAVATGRTFHILTGETPVVAMLSFSTRGSAEHANVEKVRRAARLARESDPDLAVDGELQFDAACVTAVGRRKAPDSPVAGRANVLIFPNLDAGNIAYKITERLAGATALGPIIQGLKAPFHDLSRGCAPSDITAMAIITAMQSTVLPADSLITESDRIMN